MGDKPVLAASLDIALYLDFLKKNPIASQKKLRVSTNFIILGAMDQKLLVFENFRRNLESQKTFYSLTFLGWIFFIDS
jgi:hypothetical protein